MDKLLKTIRYLFGSLFWMLIIGYISILANAAVEDFIIYFNHKNGQIVNKINGQISGNLEVTAIIFVILMGIIYFSIQFKVMLANGVSRKTFFWAYLPAYAAVSAAFALFVTLVTLIHRAFVPMITLSQAVYQGANLFDATIIQFAVYFFCGALGSLIHLAYYRSNTLMRWIITLAPFALIGLLIVWNSAASGKVSYAISKFFNAIMGFAGSTTNPYIGVITLLVLAAALYGGNYLLIRRAPLKA